jgi:hypothetical protein
MKGLFEYVKSLWRWREVRLTIGFAGRRGKAVSGVAAPMGGRAHVCLALQAATTLEGL